VNAFGDSWPPGLEHHVVTRVRDECLSLTVFGSSDSAFGTPGVGGSFGFADPDTGVGYGYVMNKLGFHPVSDPRELDLRHALFHDILKTRPQT
jgi:CubicO group peptidase (beta-lactamase class C family)